MKAITNQSVPSSIEAEAAMLGSCMHQPSAIDDCAEIVTEADFFRDAHQVLWRAITAVRAKGDEVNGVTVADWLIKAGLYQSFGGDPALADICMAAPHGANATYFAQIVKDRADIRRLIECHEDGLKECYSNQLPSADLITNAEERVFALSDTRVTGQTVDGEVLVAETMDRMTSRSGGGLMGLQTCFDDLDASTRGFNAKNLIILAARPSQGKTALAMEILRRTSSVGAKVLFISLEMSRQELGDRLLSMESHVPAEVIYKPWNMRPEQKHELYEAADRLSRLPFRIDDSPA